MPSPMPIAPPAIERVSGLDQELREDVAPLGADRHADADLARALRHRDEHDVHDPDPADEQRDRRGRGQQHRQRARGLVGRLRDLLLRSDHEVGVLARARSGAAGAGSASISACACSTAAARPADAMNMSIFVLRFEQPHHRRVGGDDDVVLVLSHRAAALGLEHADDPERKVLDAHRLADGVLAARRGTSPPSRRARTPWPPTRTSESPKKTPFSTFHDRTNGHSTPTPWICVPQLRFPATTCPAVRDDRRHVGDRRALGLAPPRRRPR